MRLSTATFLAGVILAGSTAPALADIRSKAAREAAEYAMKKFGLKVAQEGTEVLSNKIAAAVVRHGDDVLAAVRKVGPKALSLADEAGENAPRVMRFLTQHGDDAARVLGRPKGMALFNRFGDDAAEALIKHKGVAEPLMEGLGKPAVEALRAVGPQGGRRIAIMAESGELTAIGRTPELMEAIARHGDKAMEFIWRNKGALAVGTTLTAFLANPDSFIDGTNQLVGTIADSAVKPLVQEAANTISWMLRTTLTLAVIVAAGSIIFAVKYPQAAAGIAKTLLGCAGMDCRP